MPSPNNLAVVACAGGRKTQEIIDAALAASPQRTLITTYTNENQRQIVKRLQARAGVVPRHISVLGWFTFLINQCARPYQRVITERPNTLRSLNFKGQRSKYTARAAGLPYFCDGNRDLYRNSVSDFVCEANKRSDGSVVRRLERNFRLVFVDEVQDLGGYDLDVLRLMLNSSIAVTMVGDPRQSTLATNTGRRNKAFRGQGIVAWLREQERAGLCKVVERNENFRCNQAICDFADALHPGLPASRSRNDSATGHDGVFEIDPSSAAEYCRRYSPVVLRHDKNADTRGLTAMNIGVAKGSTFDRVLLFPTKPMLEYLKHRDASKLKAPDRFYVAVTRARFSVAFVVAG